MQRGSVLEDLENTYLYQQTKAIATPMIATRTQPTTITGG